MLNIETTKENGTLKISLEGRLDTMSAPDLENVLEESIDGVTELTFETSKLEYLSSAGLRVFLHTYKLMDGARTMKLTGVTDRVKEVLDVTGFSDFLTIE